MHKTVYVRKVASLVGLIISAYSVIGNIVYLMTKHLSIDINSSLVNVKHLTLDESCQQIVFSDDSGTGYGCYIVEIPIDIAHGMWLDSEKGNSSTWKELTAVKQVLLSLLHILSGKRIK